MSCPSSWLCLGIVSEMDRPHCLERSPRQEEMGISRTLWASNPPTLPEPPPAACRPFSWPLPSPGPELALQPEKVAQEESAHCILVPRAWGNTVSVNGAPNTCCLLGPWASGRWGSRRWTDLETVQAMVRKFLERLSQLEQIAFLNCPRSEERVGGFLAFEFAIFLFGPSLEITIALLTPLWPVRRHRWRMNFASLGK